nr:MAG TPA: hypothetical protein [Crassvirales sp.]
MFSNVGITFLLLRYDVFPHIPPSVFISKGMHKV